jgi:hypothetical protein
MSEQQIQQAIRLKLSQGSVRLFRNNTGALRDERGQLVRYGLCQGSADLIGIRTVTITADMVGQQVGVFAAIEVKAPRGRITPEQEAFLAMVRQQGGIAGVARSVEDAQHLLSGGNPNGCGTVSVCQHTNPISASCDQLQASEAHHGTA